MLRFTITMMAFLAFAMSSPAQPVPVDWAEALKRDASPTAAPLKQELASSVSRDQRERFQTASLWSYQNVWSSIKTLDDWKRFRERTLGTLRQTLGLEGIELGRPLANMPVRVSKTIDGDGFQVENVLYESRPGWWVSANLYKPKTVSKIPAGIVIAHSHHNPKTQSELQDMGATWARTGNYVLVPDLPGHGERRQHPFRTEKDFPKPFRVSRQDYHFRYLLGTELDLVGESILGWMAWDLSRGFDLLIKRGAHEEKLILLGSVAGGGDPAGVTAALDHRIACVVPFNFGGTQPDYKTPPEPEKDFYWYGSAYWETSRGLRGLVPHWAVVASVAPRRVICAHEFDWDRKQDPAFPFIEKVFELYGNPERLTVAKGQGNLRGQPPESSHCNNIGALHRSKIYPALQKWFDMPLPAEFSPKLASSDLLCWTPELRAELKPKPLHELLGPLAEQRSAAFATSLGTANDIALSQTVLQAWQKVLGDPPMAPKWQVRTREITTFPGLGAREEILLERLSNGPGSPRPIRMTLLVPLAKGAKNPPVVVAFAQDGRNGFLAQRRAEMVEMLQAGVAVCLPDLAGWGETGIAGDGRRHSSTSTSRSLGEWALGTTMLGQQLADLRAILSYFGETNLGVDGSRVAVWGESFATANAADATLAVPLEADAFPKIAEPGAATLALLLALSEPAKVKAIAAHGGLNSYRDCLNSPFLYVPHDALAPGVFRTGDLPLLAATLAPRPLRMTGLVDGLNRRVEVSAAKSAYTLTSTRYANAKAEKQFQLLTEEPSTAKWLIEAMK